MIRDRNTNETFTGARKVWRVGLYIRLSRDDGNEVSLSVLNQKERLNSFLESHAEEFELVDYYIDDGFTGTDTNRAGFQRLIEDIERGRVTCVIVKDVSRLSRNYIEAGQYMEQFFIEHDVRFISLELPYLDSYKHPEQMNSIIVPIQNVINDDFCRQTSIKIRGVFNTKRSKGEYIGGFAPYGYVRDPEDTHRFIIDPEAAEIVRDIFQWYVAGLSKMGIARKLNELHIPNPSAYKRLKGINYRNSMDKVSDSLWGYPTISDILKNRMYLGHMVQGRYKVKSHKVHKQIRMPEEEWFIVEGTHEPIIDEEIFAQARRLQERDGRTAPNKNQVHLWAGFLRCADCGKALTRTTAKGIAYYNCRTYREKSKEECTKHSIREDKLERVVLAVIQSQISLVSEVSDIIEAINQAPETRRQSTRIDKLIISHRSELEKTRNLLDSLYLDWKNGDISAEQYRRVQEKSEELIRRLLSAIAEAEREKETIRAGINQDNPYLTHFLQHENIGELTRSTLIDLVDTIYVHEGGEIEICFNYQDQFQLLADYIKDSGREASFTKILKIR